jgi:hypothetical protein
MAFSVYSSIEVSSFRRRDLLSGRGIAAGARKGRECLSLRAWVLVEILHVRVHGEAFILRGDHERCRAVRMTVQSRSSRPMGTYSRFLPRRRHAKARISAILVDIHKTAHYSQRCLFFDARVSLMDPVKPHAPLMRISTSSLGNNLRGNPFVCVQNSPQPGPT